MTLAPEERAEARRLCDAATPGPWEAEHLEGGDSRVLASRRTEDGAEAISIAICWWRGHEDASFIAAARTLVPRLLDALEAAEQTNAQLVRERDEALAFRNRLASDALSALAGSHVCTPVEGYLKSPSCLSANIHDLRSERDTARAQLATERDEAQRHLEIRITAEQARDTARTHVATLAEALRWYAREFVYDRPTQRNGYLDPQDWTEGESDVEGDRGEVARAALKAAGLKI